MATTPTQTHALLSISFSHQTDFTVLADHCQQFVQTLVESDHPAEKLALCGRLSTCLALLQPTLNDPVPPELVESLSIDDLPARLPAFEPDGDQLAQYCQSLTQLLMRGGLSADMERVLGDLLCDLVSYFAEILNAPRWIKTVDGYVLIEDLMH